MHALGRQPGNRLGAHMAQEMAQCFVDRQGLLLAVGELIDVFEDLEFGIAELKIQLAAAAQLA